MTARAWDNGDADGDFNNGNNWDPDGAPDQSDALTIDGSVPGNITVTSPNDFLSLDMTGYSDTFDCNGNQMRAWGDVTWSSVMTGLRLNTFAEADMTLFSSGQYMERIGDDSFAVEFTLGEALVVTSVSFGVPGSVLAFGANQLILQSGPIFNTPTLNLNNGAVAGASYSPGATITFNLLAIDPAAQLTSDVTITLPPISVIGEALSSLSINSFVVCESFTQDGPDIQYGGNNMHVLGGMTLSNGSMLSAPGEVTVDGNFLDDGVDLTGGIYIVAGTAVANNRVVANCDFSGGTALNATNGCTDGGGNTNVNFGTPVRTFDNDNTDNDLNNPNNWSDDISPINSTDAVIGAAATGDPFGSIACRNLDCSGLVYSLANASFNIYGDAVLGANIEVGPTHWFANGAFDSAGVLCDQVEATNGFVVTLTSDLRALDLTVINGNGGFIIDGFDITIVVPDTEEEGVYLPSSPFQSSFSYQPGDTLTYDLQDSGSGQTYGDIQFENVVGPNVVVAGGGYLYPFTGAPLHLQSLNVDGEGTGGMYFDQIEDLTTVGPMTFTNAKLTQDEVTDDLNGCVLTCGTNFVSNGTNLKNGSLAATGTAFAHDCTITNFDASGGNTLDATDNCIDGGGNTNVTFGAAGVTITNVTSAKPNGTYAEGTVIDVQVELSGVATVTGTPRLLMDVGQATYAPYLSGSGTDTLTFRYTVAAGDNSADLDYDGTSALELNGGTIKDGEDADVDLTLPTPGGAGSLAANKALIIDSVAPYVMGVTSAHANGSFGAGETVDVQVNWSESVIVTGAPRLVLDLHPARHAEYLSGSGSSTLVFRIVTKSPDNTADLDYRTQNALQLNGGTIKDSVGHNAALTLPSPGAAGSLGANKAIAVATAGAQKGNVGFGSNWGFGLGG